MRLLAGIVLSVCLLAPSISSGHTLMMSPTPRNDDDGLKVGPCGNVAPTGSPTVLTAGETVVVDWLETIDHPGYYRIAFSLEGDQGFDDNVLADNITDIACGAPPCSYTAQITVPNEPCENCALQLIQYMGNAPPYSLYYSCADITVLAAPAPDGGPADPPDDPGDVGSDAGIGDDDTSTDGEVTGGCSASAAGGSPGAAHIALVFAALVLIRRRS